MDCRRKVELEKYTRMTAQPNSPSCTVLQSDAGLSQVINDSVTDAVLTIDSEGNISACNAAAERIFGYTVTEIIGTNVDLLMPGDVLGRHSRYCIKTGESEESGSLHELEAVRKNGVKISVELSIGQVSGTGQPQHVCVVRDISTRKRTEHDLIANLEMLSNLSDIQSDFILEGDPSVAFDKLLEKILAVTDSEYGFIGEIKHRSNGIPYLVTQSITDISWSEETRKFFAENAPKGMEFTNLKSLFGVGITSGKPVISNDPGNDPRSGGLPHGHPPLNAFLGLPFHIGDRLVGMVGIANRTDGYSEDFVRLLSPLMVTCANLMSALESTRKRVEAEKALMAANAQLASTVAEIQNRNLEITQLSELEDLLQSCETREEAYSVVAYMSKIIFPDTDGALYSFDADSSNLELMHSWGDEVIETVFLAHNCMGLRRGRAHISAGGGTPLNCRHVDNDQYVSLCVPLIGKNESFGVLQLLRMRSDSAGPALAAAKELAVTVSRRIAIAFANLKLSSKLREQSLRDPLTSLFNRRFMTETLDRELARAEREEDGSVSLVLIDLDRFKHLNDTYGHGAGDSVLVEVGRLLDRFSRNSDVACRMGGEEFVLVLPNCSLRAATERAERIRMAFSDLVFTYSGQSLGNVTLSAGVATFPACAINSENLMQEADAAMYRAKNNGRDQVEVAPLLEQTQALRCINPAQE